MIHTSNEQMTKEKMCIVMEYCKYGTLTDLLRASPLPPQFKLKCALDASRGMQFLHENKIMHRDFKPDNLLVVSKSPNSAVCVKITDFGTSRLVSDDTAKNYTKGLGTPIYMSPELVYFFENAYFTINFLFLQSLKASRTHSLPTCSRLPCRFGRFGHRNNREPFFSL